MEAHHRALENECKEKCVQIIFWVAASVDLLKKKMLRNQNMEESVWKASSGFGMIHLVLNLVTHSGQIWMKLSESNELM